MHDDPQEELISAYLDGELNAEEQRQVERLLAGSAEARQLHEELRSLRAAFEALPRYRLPDDLSQRVLRRAEEELLRKESPAMEPAQPNLDRPARAVESAVADNTTGSSEADEKRVLDASQSERSWPRPRTWRAIFWPVMAVAAAVAMMVAGPKQRGADREIARAPTASDEAKQTAPQPAAEIGAAPQGALLGGGGTDRAEAQRDVEGSLPDIAQPTVADNGLAADRRQETQLRKAAPATRALARSERESGDFAEQIADEENESFRPAAPPIRGFAKRGTGAASEGPEPPNAPASDMPDTSTDLAASAAGPTAAFGAVAGAMGSADVYVIDVELTPEAVRQQAFEQLLVRNRLAEPIADLGLEADESDQVEREKVASDLKKQANSTGKSLAAAKHKPLDAERKPSAKAETAAAQSATAQDALAENAAPENGLAQNAAAAGTADDSSLLREVTVAATPEQFVATLRDLRQHPQQFSTTSVGFASAEGIANNRSGELRASPQELGDRDAADGVPAQTIPAQSGVAAALQQPAGKKQSLAEGQRKRSDLARGEADKDNRAADSDSADRLAGGKGAAPSATAEKAKQAARADGAAKQVDEAEPEPTKSDGKNSTLAGKARRSAVPSAPSATPPGPSAGSGGANPPGSVQFRNKEGKVQLNLAPASRAAPNAAAPPSVPQAQAAKPFGTTQPQAAAAEDSPATGSPAQAEQTVRLIFRLHVTDPAAASGATQTLPVAPAAKPAP